MAALHRNMPRIMIVLGLVIAIASYLADLLGMGTWQGLGTRQVSAMLFGLILTTNGVTIWAIRERR